MRLRTAFLAGACALAGAAAAAATPATPATSTLRFAALSGCEAMTHKPARAPDIGAAIAEVTMPAGWHTIRVPAYVGSGLRCAIPYLLSDRPGDANRCLPLTATASNNTSGRSLAAYLRVGESEVGHGALPAVAGMHGLWEELETGMVPASAYAIEAAYQSASSKLVYEITLDPAQPPDSGCPRGSSSRSREFARKVAESFRVALSG